MTLKIYTSDKMLKHDTGHNHPECPARLETLFNLFEEEFANIEVVQAEPADEEAIARAHPLDYLYSLMDQTPDVGLQPVDAESECILSPSSYEAILLSAGASLNALRDIMNGETNRAFCAIRPPGHHAEVQKPMGFCFLNNAFITARSAQEDHGLSRIAILDFDVHHGNGTDAVTRAHNLKHPEKPIFYASTHQYPLWPMSGLPEDNTEYVVNVTLAEDSNGKDMLAAYQDHVFPALENYKPELIILSSGFDAHKDDPLAGLSLTSEDFGTLTSAFVELAHKHANGRVLSLLEGGYDLNALKDSTRAHLKTLQAFS
ncbi:MAG: histone deacetylase family protein [Pseudomonadota bacterium]